MFNCFSCSVIVLESARRSRLAGHYRCASVPRDAPRVLSHEPACVQRGPRRPKLQGGLPRTLCNVQAVVNASAKGSASSDPRGAKGSASSDPPCSPCACAPWMTRKHSKRAHANSRRSRSLCGPKGLRQELKQVQRRSPWLEQQRKEHKSTRRRG